MNKVSVFEPKDCRRTQELLDHFLAGELTVESNQEILHHLGHCSACQAEENSRLEARRLLVEGWNSQPVPPRPRRSGRRRFGSQNQGSAAGTSTSGGVGVDGDEHRSVRVVFPLDERECGIADGCRSL